MAKITNPLMSIEAVGTIGQFLTFSKRDSGQQVRWQKKQIDVITDLRLEQRSNFLNGSISARFFETGNANCGVAVCGFDILDLNNAVVKKPLTGYNLGIQEFLNY